MAKTKRPSVRKELETLLRHAINSDVDREWTAKDLAPIVLTSGGVAQAMLNRIQEQAVERYISNILTRASITLDDGTKVRAFQAYTKFQQTEDGKEQQIFIWKDIENMSRAQMLIAVRERVKHVTDCKAMCNADVQYWNTHVRPKVGGQQIPLPFPDLR